MKDNSKARRSVARVLAVRDKDWLNKNGDVLEDGDEKLHTVKKLLDESNEIVDRIKALKAERAQLQPPVSYTHLTLPTNREV